MSLRQNFIEMKILALMAVVQPEPLRRSMTFQPTFWMEVTFKLRALLRLC